MMDDAVDLVKLVETLEKRKLDKIISAENALKVNYITLDRARSILDAVDRINKKFAADMAAINYVMELIRENEMLEEIKKG